MLGVIDPLRAAFDVVCVSLPGFGFSGPTTERGWHPRRIAAAMVELMGRLGYPRFGTLGGDWGATISNYIGLDFPEHLYGLYLTMVAAGPPAGSDGSELRHHEKEWVAANATFFAEESGYLQIQATRPQTLAYGLTDSPAGLAGWIVEKLRAWSDCGGDLESAISRDDILANITLYWVTGTANSAARIYLEAMRAGQLQPIASRIEVPTGCAIFPKETVRSPRAWADEAWDVRRWTEMPRGGHFAALEVPDLLVPDVCAFYRELRRTPTVTPGRRPWTGKGKRDRPGVEWRAIAVAETGGISVGTGHTLQTSDTRSRGSGGGGTVASLVGLAHRGAPRPVDGQDAVRRDAAAGRARRRWGLVVHRRAQDDVVPGHSARDAVREEPRHPSHVGNLRRGRRRRLRPPRLRDGERGRRCVGERALSLGGAGPVRCAHHRRRDEGDACLQRLDCGVLCQRAPSAQGHCHAEPGRSPGRRGGAAPLPRTRPGGCADHRGAAAVGALSKS